MDTKLMLSDANPDSWQMLVDVLANSLSYQVFPVKRPRQIIEQLDKMQDCFPEAILMDVTQNMDEVREVLQQLQVRFPCLPVIALTDYGNMKQAGVALREGAVDYLPRPVSHQRLKLTIDNTVARYRLTQEISRMRYRQASRHEEEYLPSGNPRIARLLQQYPIKQGPVLFSGEQGTGKEIFARTLHLHEQTQHLPFVAINCYPLAETQAWSILFGEAKDRKENAQLSNKLSGAVGGTLFINGVESLSLGAQKHLIDMLNKRDQIYADESQRIRFMAATRLPAQEVWSSDELSPRLQEYFAANLVSLPALRRSTQDIPELAQYYTQRFAEQEKPVVQSITSQAIELLQKYDWPENVAELERTIFKAVLTCEDAQLDVEDLLPYMPNSFAPDLSTMESRNSVTRFGKMPITNNHGDVRRLRDLEADMIQYALSYYNGQISEVARKLGIGRSTLYRKLHELDIKVA